MSKLFGCITVKKDGHKKRKEINIASKQAERINKATYQLLLLGTDGSGKSTIAERMKTLHDPYTQEQRIDKISRIKRNIRDSLTYILHGFNTMVPPVQLEHPENEWRALYMLTRAHQFDFNYPAQFYEHATILLDDASVQACFERSNKSKFVDCARYFLDRINEAKEPNYIPSDEDMLRCRVLTLGVHETIIIMHRIRLRIIDVREQRSNPEKWIQCFTDITAIIFVTDCSNFDSMLVEDEHQNRLQQSIDLFKTIWNNELLQTKSVILLLNKQDLLVDKIKNGVRLENYFPDFARYVISTVESDETMSKGDSEVNRAQCFIRDEFLRVIQTNNENNHYCYPHFTSIIDTENFDWLYNDCRDIIGRACLRQYKLL